MPPPGIKEFLKFLINIGVVQEEQDNYLIMIHYNPLLIVTHLLYYNIRYHHQYLQYLGLPSLGFLAFPGWINYTTRIALVTSPSTVLGPMRKASTTQGRHS